MRTLLAILDRYLPDQNGIGAYTDCQRMLRSKFRENTWIEDALDPVRAAGHYRQWLEFVDSRCAIPPIAISQIFDGTDLTIHGEHTYCDQRISLFEKTKVISRICHDCFKVQVLPADLRALMQIHFVFRALALPRDNARKCMVELRENVPYPYKAYIFCESEEEAKNCLEILRNILERNEIRGAYCGLSHGCSEYGLEYPAFKYASDGGHRSFESPASWDRVESEYWSATPLPALSGKSRKKMGISIRDIIGYRTWIDYAELIGDDSWTLFREAPSANKPRHFAGRVGRQSQLRNAQMKELRQRILPTA